MDKNIIQQQQTFIIKSTAMPLYKIVILLFVSWVTIAQTNRKLQRFKSQMEGKVRSLANAMVSAYADRCDSENYQCQAKTYNECEGTATRQCYQDIPNHKDCYDGGAFMGTEPGIRFPPGKRMSNLTPEDKEFICASSKVNKKLKSLDRGREQRYSIAYMGSSLGFTKGYPSLKADCDSYDPRFRPWYVAATTGRKNVIILLDISGSMVEEDPLRIGLAKEAAKRVVKTLGISDTFAVISFNTETKSLGYNRLVRGTDSAKNVVEKEINKLKAEGDTSFFAAFSKAFDMMDESEVLKTQCDGTTENIILFLTDGEPTDNTTIEELYQMIDSRSDGYNITLFTYGLGSENDTEIDNGTAGVNLTLLTEMSCRYEGIMFDVTDQNKDLTTIMAEYKTYLAGQIEIQRPIWTEPYEDAFGFGVLITVAYPIYYREEEGETSLKKILGVAAIDVTVESMRRFGINQKQITNLFLNDFPCTSVDFAPCELERLRSDTAKCYQVQCSEVETFNETCLSRYTALSQKDMFLNPQDTTENFCCGQTLKQFIAILVVVVISVLAGIVIALIYYKRRRKDRKKKKTHRRRSSQDGDEEEEQEQSADRQPSSARRLGNR